MNERSTPWRDYEEVAQYLLNQFASHFRLGSVEGKQVVPGLSGVTWELDAKGTTIDGQGFVIVECRRRTSSRISQESAGALAFRIKDTGASGGIFVAPLDLQVGAKRIAAGSKIEHVTLDPASTTTKYVMRFLNRVFLGVEDACSVTLKESVTIDVFEDGKRVDERHYE